MSKQNQKVARNPNSENTETIKNEIKSIKDAIEKIIEKIGNSYIDREFETIYSYKLDKLEPEIYELAEKFDINIVECEYLCTDGRWHGPLTNYYIAVEYGTLVVTTDHSPTYIDERWPTALALEMGKQHPARVLEIVAEHEEWLDGWKIDDAKKFVLEVSGEPGEESIKVYKILESEFLKYTNFSEIQKLQVIDEYNDKFIIYKVISRVQGSPDYVLLSEEEYQCD